MPKYVLRKSNSFGDNDDTYYEAKNTFALLKYLYKNIDLTYYFEEILDKIANDMQKSQDEDSFLFNIYPVEYDIDFLNKRKLIKHAKKVHDITFESITNDDILQDMLSCKFENLLKIYRNAIIIYKLYSVDKKSVINSLSKKELKAIFEYLYTPGEGIQEGIPGKEWYGKTIERYSEPKFIQVD